MKQWAKQTSVTFFAIGATLLAGGSAMAQNQPWTRAELYRNGGGACGSGGPQMWGNGPVSVANASTCFANPANLNSAQLRTGDRASSDFGSVGFSTRIELLNDLYDWQNGGQSPFYNPTMSAAAWWSDALIVESDRLALGTTVNLEVTTIVDLASKISSNPRIEMVSGLGSLSEYSFQVGRNVRTQNLTATVGQVFNFAFYLDVDSYVWGDGVTPYWLAEARGTARSFITPTTMGAKLISVSGHDYFLAPGGVPEPSVWAMMLFGFGFTGRSLRRKKGLPRVTA